MRDAHPRLDPRPSQPVSRFPPKLDHRNPQCAQRGPAAARLLRHGRAKERWPRAGRDYPRTYPDGDVVAVLEIVSPGNKDSWHALRAFARKAVEFLQAGVHLLIVDLFPPSRRDPQGIHKATWDRIHEEPFSPPPDKPLTLAAYAAGTET